MALTFHDGTNPLYSGYCQGSAWNDPLMLGLNPARDYDELLIGTYNIEAKIRTLFDGGTVRNCCPEGPGTSRLGDYVDSIGRELIIIKGLHQWIKKEGTGKAKSGCNYQLHLSFGLNGLLWHQNATYYADKKKIVLGWECSAGTRKSKTDHEGFTTV